MYKLLVLDLDDTLLNSDRQISKRNKDAIMKVQEQGVKVVLASGRPTGGMVGFSNELQLDKFDSYMISFNGGEIVESGSLKIVFEKSLSMHEIHDLYDFSREHKVDIITYKDEYIISEDSSEYIDVEIDLLNIPIKRVESFKTEVDYSAIKCILLAEPTYLKSVEDIIKNRFHDKSVSISKPFFLEVTAEGIDKGHTLDKLCAIEGITSDEVIAIGNAENDLSMIKYAGLGIWVENTDDELKQFGDAVTASHDDDGVALAIEKYLLK